jgi:hypothetical protein
MAFADLDQFEETATNITAKLLGNIQVDQDIVKFLLSLICRELSSLIELIS